MSFRLRYPHEEIIERVLEGGSVTAVKGNLGYLDANGVALECASDAANIDFIFAEDAHNGSSGANWVRVWKIKPGVEYSAKANTTTAQATLGRVCSVVLDTSVFYVDPSDEGNDRVKMVGIDPREAVGTDGGRYFVTFMSAVMETEV